MNAKRLNSFNIASYAMKPMHGSYQGHQGMDMSSKTGPSTGALGGTIVSDAFVPSKDTSSENIPYTRKSFISPKQATVPTNLVQNPHLFGNSSSILGGASKSHSTGQSQSVSTVKDVPPPRKQFSVEVSDMAALTAKLSKEKNGASDFRDIENSMGVRFDQSKGSRTNMGGAMFR